MLELYEYHVGDMISLKKERKKKNTNISGSIFFAPIHFEISNSTEHVEHLPLRSPSTSSPIVVLSLFKVWLVSILIHGYIFLEFRV